ncbi:unnamed protein product [Hermetia illucens]|uniref:Uncharacterized protein n=1 Tax=Hermetia illucens TaxID=343691 RepID=A0A7R8UW66_HERIL|nr:unnamed protein product [Hermetia illucens]
MEARLKGWNRESPLAKEEQESEQRRSKCLCVKGGKTLCGRARICVRFEANEEARAVSGEQPVLNENKREK